MMKKKMMTPYVKMKFILSQGQWLTTTGDIEIKKDETQTTEEESKSLNRKI